MKGPGQLSEDIIIAMRESEIMYSVKENWLREIPKHIWGR